MSSEKSGPVVNPYEFRAEDVEAPPRTFDATMRRIGPGLILTASIVGSGELIATTTLGAEVGYTLLWVILVSCVIKTVIQALLGRYTIATGETGLEALNHMPGPRILALSWTVWIWAIVAFLVSLPLGAMYGGVSQVANLMLPGIDIDVWVGLFAVASLALLLTGSYARVEFLATLMVVMFTFLTVVTAAMLVTHPEYFSWGELLEGLKFKVPDKGFVTAVAVFGITGVAATELVAYPYWCLEKGYARFTGPRDNTQAWLDRANGWIRVMHFDIVVSLIIYTFATIAFYLLGAGVLHGMGLVPKGLEMIKTLSNTFTEILGPWGLYLFYIGAIVVLYSTIFSATAVLARQFTDMAKMGGMRSLDDFGKRLVFQRWAIVVLIIVPIAFYYAFKSPVAMVKAGGVAIALLLPVVGFSAVYLRHRRLVRELAPSPWITAALWLTTVIATVGMIWYALMQIPR